MKNRKRGRAHRRAHSFGSRWLCCSWAWAKFTEKASRVDGILWLGQGRGHAAAPWTRASLAGAAVSNASHVHLAVWGCLTGKLSHCFFFVLKTYLILIGAGQILSWIWFNCYASNFTSQQENKTFFSALTHSFK